MKFAMLRKSNLLPVVMAAGLLSCAATPAVSRPDIGPGIDNFSRIDGSSGFAGSTAGFGGPTRPSAMPALKSAGFRSVINLRLATEEGADIDASRSAAEASGLNYIHEPLDRENFDSAAVDSLLQAMGDEANQPVYVHCGSSTRAAALWMIGRVTVDGWDIDAASREARAIAKKPDEAVEIATRYIESQRAGR